MEREVGRGIGMGNTCKSMADSCQCMTKPLQYCKVISLQLINEKRKKKEKLLMKKKKDKLGVGEISPYPATVDLS